MSIATLRKLLEGTKLTLLDVGARGGIHPRWNPVRELIDVIGFEPDERECRRLTEQVPHSPYSARFLPYALGRADAERRTFNICAAPGCSSFYEPNWSLVGHFDFAPNMERTDRTELRTTTMTTACARESIQPDVIKIDTQGSELEILEGGKELLTSSCFAELEVEFNPQYAGQPLFHDVDRFMREQGWMLLGLRRTYWRHRHGLEASGNGSGGHLMHGDAIYYNRDLLDQTRDTAAVAKMLIALSAYRQYDFVFALLRGEKLRSAPINRHEREQLERFLTRRPGVLTRVVRRFVPRHSRVRRAIADALQPGDAVDWHDPDFF